MRVALILGVWLLASCGRTIDGASDPLATEPTVDAIDPFADAEIDVSGGPDSDLCFSASMASLDVAIERRCFSPPYLHVVLFVAGDLVEFDDPQVNSASLLVSPYPIVVTDVRQGDDTVRWHQEGSGVLILGKSLFAAPTTVTFDLDGEQGVCEIRPDGESCRVG